MAFGYIHFIRILEFIFLASCTNSRGAFYDAAIGEFCEVHMDCSEASSSNDMQDEPLNFCAKRVKQSEEVPSSLQCGQKFSKHFENGYLFGETSVTLVNKNNDIVEDDQPSSSGAISFSKDQNNIDIYGMPLDPAESQTFVNRAEYIAKSQMQCMQYNFKNPSTTVTLTNSSEIPCCSNSLANPVQGLDNALVKLPTVDLDHSKIQEWMDNGMHVQSSFVSMISTARKFKGAIESLYYSRYGYMYADFYAFFKANNDLMIPPEKNSTLLYSQNFYAKYKLDEEIRLRYMNICNILTGTVYSLQKECIENRIKNTIYKDSVRFLSTDQLKYETKTRFAMIYDPSSFDLIDQVFLDSVQVDYDTYLQKITELNDNNDICAVFTDFLTRNLFYKNNEHDLYVFKPQLRKLQLFMPELYFYVLWKIKTIANAVSYTQSKDHIVKEMRHIKILLQFFYELCGETTDHSIFVRHLQDQVNFYRGFIMTYLNEQHQKTLAHLFFHQAFHSSTSQYDVAAKHCVRSLLYILAFTSNPFGFSKLTHEILKEPRSKVYNLNIGNFLHGKLLCVRCLKKETIATLLLVVSFLKEQNMPNTSDAYDLPVVLSFFETNTHVSYNEKDNLCDVYSMSRIEICLYLYNAIQDAIMSNK